MYRRILLSAVLGLGLSGCVPYYVDSGGYGSSVYVAPAGYYYPAYSPIYYRGYYGPRYYGGYAPYYRGGYGGGYYRGGYRHHGH